MPPIQRQPLELPGENPPKLRYTPLPALGVADYYTRYVTHLGQTGVFDYLSTSGAGLNISDVRDLDLSAIGVVGSAFARLLVGDGGAKPLNIGEIALDHAARFGVQAWDVDSEDWVALADADAFNRYISPEHMFDLVRVLGGEALRPLWSRLASSGGAKPSASPKPSPASEATS
jgi:hypothetical protein